MKESEKERVFVYDLDAIISFIFSDDGKRSNNSEITETYVNDEENNGLVLMNKQLKEYKDNDMSSKQTIKYDLLKLMLETMNGMESENDSSVGEKIMLNTLITNKLITTTTEE